MNEKMAKSHGKERFNAKDFPVTVTHNGFGTPMFFINDPDLLLSFFTTKNDKIDKTLDGELLM